VAQFPFLCFVGWVMKHLTLLTAILIATLSAATAGDDWMTNYKDALAKAKAENRPVLVDFTGSDWCGWCIKLDEQTFSKKAFQDFAKDNLVLLEIDFPQGKKQPAELKAQNEKLQKEFGVRGFPTLVLLNSEGKEIARNPGFLAGGPDAMINWVQEKSR